MPRKTAQFIEEQKAAITVEGSDKVFIRKHRKHKRPNKKMSAKELANLKPFPKGISGNPGGLPGTDVSALHARALFERHPVSPNGLKDLATELKGFNAYGFNVLADRGYGKVKDRTVVEHTGPDGHALEIKITIEKPQDVGS